MKNFYQTNEVSEHLIGLIPIQQKRQPNQVQLPYIETQV